MAKVIIGLIAIALAVKYWYITLCLLIFFLVVDFAIKVHLRRAESCFNNNAEAKDNFVGIVNEFIKDLRCQSCKSDLVPIYKIDIDYNPTLTNCCCKPFADILHTRIRGKYFFITTAVLALRRECSQRNKHETLTGAKASDSKHVDPCWIPHGQTIQHKGYTIPDGLIYFGTGLKSINNASEEPSLINPNLPISKHNCDCRGQNMNYWPSYSDIPSSSRSAYLGWLSGKRKDPNANIGYVFLYFYGLERRVLADAKASASAQDDIPIIITEVKRLLTIYGDNSSFHGYASRFVDVMEASQTTEPLYNNPPRFMLCPNEVPILLKIALGQMAVSNIPLSAEWALAWAENDPLMPRRKTIQRCQQKFAELFQIRYVENFPDGLKLEPNKERIQAMYRPASSSFGRFIEIPMPNLPDLTASSDPSGKISDIVLECLHELEEYSRYLGRNPDGKDALAATSYLPAPLLKKHAVKQFQDITSWLDGKIPPDGYVKVPFLSILQHIPSIKSDGFGKKEMTAVANILGMINIGIEPDLRFGAFIPKMEQDVVLFPLSENTPIFVSEGYSTATVAVHLAAAIIATDMAADHNLERHLNEHSEIWQDLPPDEKARLRAHTQWLLTSFPGMTGMKKRIAEIHPRKRSALGKFLVVVAQTDGYIGLSEMKTLTKIYGLLGLDSNTLFSHAHTAALEPVTIQTGDYLKPQNYNIPEPQKPSGGISLNMSTVEAKLAETVAVSALLNNIFADQELLPTVASIPASTATEGGIAGIDTETFSFMKELAAKIFWSREELKQLAGKYNLMLDGTLDAINDASFDRFGAPFFEGDGQIEINVEIAAEIFT